MEPQKPWEIPTGEEIQQERERAEKKAAEEVQTAKEQAEKELYKSAIIDLRKYVGFTPSGVKDMREKIQACFDVAAAVGAEKEQGCLVQWVPWQMLIGGTLEIDNWVGILGLGKAGVLKLGAGVNAAMLRSKRWKAGGENGGSENNLIKDFYLDSNFAQNGTIPAGTAAIGLDGIRQIVFNLEVKNGVINLEQVMSRNKSPGTEKLEDSILAFIGCKDPQEQNIIVTSHDTHLIDALCRSNVAGSENIQLGGAGTLGSNCHCYGNAKYSYRLTSLNELVNCIGEGGREGQVKIEHDGCSIKAGRYFYGGGADGKIGIIFGDGEKTANSTQVEGVRVEECTNGAFQGGTAGTGSCRITGWVNGSSGNAFTGTWGSSTERDVKISGGMNFGVNGSLTESAAAEELEIPSNARRAGGIIVWKVTGATEIKKLKTVPPAKTMVVLILTSTAKVIDGENLKLAGNLEGVANRTLTLMSDGTNLFELCRSAT